MANTQFELSPPPTDAISSLRFAPSTPRLLVASWDKNVYLYSISPTSSEMLQTFAHRAPVLDICWSGDEAEFYSSGLDGDVRKVNISSGEQTVLSTHTAGVKSLAYSATHNLLVSASWDSTLHIHSFSSPQSPPTQIALPSKPFSISLSSSKLVVAMAARKLYIYDLTSLTASPNPNTSESHKPWQQRESSLKFLTRAVACMPNDSGYASSSIEGRIAVEWFDPSTDSQARKYAFKCHRQASPEGIDMVYPVNALAFNPIHGTFASGGGDGVVAIWDAVAKRRIRQYQRYPASVAALAFSSDGRFLAVGVCEGFEDGTEGVGEEGTRVFVRELGEAEAKGKGPK